ncbi:hypothetical protein TRFO_07308 [Tritrichomonas foetus]|uniref:Exportin-1/Importin-beta-like domain-containing protein n=1 Tax=Tritrichomonas foetus TaxID=1144522 RepID=A0A1J4JX49_9EUKA|nr:hypothetical protein TRFO_07308 [Tritrichomonas foetus]|eukprot:OHT02108.1 hypothetical protein TRFO_07308 [Tritrichomonas foetus]
MSLFLCTKRIIFSKHLSEKIQLNIGDLPFNFSQFIWSPILLSLNFMQGIEEFLNLLNFLRSPNPNENMMASNAIQELCKSPNTIYILFNCLDILQDETLRLYALAILPNCFRNTANLISQENFMVCRSKILANLQRETNNLCISSTINVICTMINVYPAPWPEITNFVFSSECQNLYTTISLLNSFISRLTPDELLQNQEFLMNITLSGINSENLDISIISVSLLYSYYDNILEKIPNNVPPFSPFQQPLLNLFMQILNSGHIRDLLEFLRPVLNGAENNFFIFPFDLSIPLIFNFIGQEANDPIMKLLIHNFLVSLLKTPDLSEFLKQENFQNMILLEKHMMDILLSENIESYDDFFEDIELGLSIVFQKMSPNDCIQFSITNGQNFLESNNISQVCFALMIFNSAVNEKMQYFSKESLNYIYSTYLNAMNSSNKVILILVGTILKNHFQNYHEQANEFLMETMNSLMKYLACVNKNFTILVDFVSQLENSDTVFEPLLNFSTHLIKTGTIIDQHDGYCLISELIKKSEEKIFQIFESLYQLLLSIIIQPLLMQDPHYLVLYCLSDLVSVAPERLLSHFPEFMNPICHALLTSKDETFLPAYFDALIFLIDHYFEEYSDLFMQPFDFMMKILNKNWEEKLNQQQIDPFKSMKICYKFLNATFSLFYLAKLSAFIQNDAFTNTLLGKISSYLSICKASNIPQEYLLKSLLCILECLDSPNEQCTIITSQCIDIFINTTDESVLSDFFPVLRSFANLGCINAETSFELMKTSLQLTTTIPNFNSDHLLASDIIVLVVNCARLVDIEQFIQFFYSFYAQRCQIEGHVSIFCINLIKNLDIEQIIPLIKSSSFTELRENIGKIIAEGPNDLATAIVNFMIALVKMVDRLQVIPFAETLLVASKNRLAAEISNKTALRESLATFISILAGQIVGDSFPFNELLPLIIEILPIRYDYSLCYDIYQFLGSTCNYIFTPEMKQVFIVKIIFLFAQPLHKLREMKVDDLILSSLIRCIHDTLQENDNDAFILQILGGNQELLSLYHNSLEYVKQKSQEVVNSMMLKM